MKSQEMDKWNLYALFPAPVVPLLPRTVPCYHFLMDTKKAEAVQKYRLTAKTPTNSLTLLSLKTLMSHEVLRGLLYQYTGFSRNESNNLERTGT